MTEQILTKRCRACCPYCGRQCKKEIEHDQSKYGIVGLIWHECDGINKHHKWLDAQ